jgi:hypothetical protein
MVLPVIRFQLCEHGQPSNLQNSCYTAGSQQAPLQVSCRVSDGSKVRLAIMTSAVIWSGWSHPLLPTNKGLAKVKAVAFYCYLTRPFLLTTAHCCTRSSSSNVTELQMFINGTSVSNCALCKVWGHAYVHGRGCANTKINVYSHNIPLLKLGGVHDQGVQSNNIMSHTGRHGSM